jgi:hypothetical protein
MTARPYLIILAVSIFLLFYPIDASFGLRCSSRVIDVGDSKHRVLSFCGDPDHVEEKEIERLIGYPYHHKRDPHDKYYYYFNNYGYDFKETVYIEIWTYNFGPTRLIRYLTFEDGTLKKITSGQRGY